MMDWKPIETAPKDGSKLLGWEPPDSIYISPVLYVVCWWSGNGWARDGDDFDLVAEPSHWMPLPEPPSAEKQSIGQAALRMMVKP